MGDELEKQTNQIKQWWQQSKFNSERADRLFNDFIQGPDKYIDPELRPSENWNSIKQEYNLTTRGARDHDRGKYEAKAEDRVLQQMTDRNNQLVTVEELNIPNNLVVSEIERCFSVIEIIDESYKTVNLTIPLKLEQALNRIKRDENLDKDNTTTQETQRGLLLYGLPEVVQLIYEDILPDDLTIDDQSREFQTDDPHDEVLSDELQELPAYREVTKCTAEYVPGTSQGYIDQDVRSSLDFPGDNTSEETSFKIYPGQKEMLEWISGQLGISQSDAYRWSLLVAASAWANQSDEFPEPTQTELEEMEDAIHTQVQEKAAIIRLSFILTVTEAFQAGYGRKVLDDCVSEYPELMLDYLITVRAIGIQVSEHVEGNLGSIAEDLSHHPLDILESIPEPKEEKLPEYPPYSGEQDQGDQEEG